MLSVSTKDPSVSASAHIRVVVVFFLLPHHVPHFKQHHETVMYALCLAGLHQWTISQHFCTEVDVLVSNVWSGSIMNIKQVRVFLRKVAGTFVDILTLGLVQSNCVSMGVLWVYPWTSSVR